MKPTSSRAATARVLADIDAAVRPVERARTAAAVDRVLSSAAPSIWGNGSDDGGQVARSLCAEVGIEHADDSHHDTLAASGWCECLDWYVPAEFIPVTPHGCQPTCDTCRAEVSDPCTLSPHLFPTDPS